MADVSFVTQERAALDYHGGNLAAARHAFPDAREPWIDLSTGINGVPYPFDMPASARFERLPEAAVLAELEALASRAYGAPAEVHLVAAPGTQAIIQWLPVLFQARRVGILGPTYGEHELGWRAAGAEIVHAERLDELYACDVAVVVNPNNPDGRLVAVDELIALHAGRLLIVDEAFMDVMGPGMSLVPHLPAERAVVLRSFGKVFGLAGLRLGFAAASPDVGPRLRRALGPWCVSGPAIDIGKQALADRDWLQTTIRRLEAQSRRLDAMLAEAGFHVIGGTPLFRLAAHPGAGGWFDRLGRAGILVRPFAHELTWLRFGIPADAAAWARLAAALRPA